MATTIDGRTVRQTWRVSANERGFGEVRCDGALVEGVTSISIECAAGEMPAIALRIEAPVEIDASQLVDAPTED